LHMYLGLSRRINELSLNTARTRYDIPKVVQREKVAPQLGRIGSGLLFGGARPLASGRSQGRASELLMPGGVHFAQHRPTKWNHRARVSKVQVRIHQMEIWSVEDRPYQAGRSDGSLPPRSKYIPHCSRGLKRSQRFILHKLGLSGKACGAPSLQGCRHTPASGGPLRGIVPQVSTV
jgi:hypothetical protein